jgi:hypothetical protein
MPQSPTLDVGMDVHQASLAVASGTQAHGAAVVFLGAIGPRPCTIAPLIRKRPSKATPLVLVDEAGP